MGNGRRSRNKFQFLLSSRPADCTERERAKEEESTRCMRGALPSRHTNNLYRLKPPFYCAREIVVVPNICSFCLRVNKAIFIYLLWYLAIFVYRVIHMHGRDLYVRQNSL